MITAVDSIRALFKHLAWSDIRMLEALQNASHVPDEALRELAHIVGAEEVWLARIEQRPSRCVVWPPLTLEQVASLGTSVRQGYDKLLRELPPERITQDVSYTNSAGQAFITPTGDILLHVALHGQYHRGKVNVLLRQAGLEPAPADYISFVRGVPAATQRQRVVEDDVRTLILPGLYDSGPDHWQSRWERLDASCERVVQREWATPQCAEWVATLDSAIASSSRPVVLVGHSSSCGMVAHWARQATDDQLRKVRGALLVAPSDPLGPAYPPGPTGFAPIPMQRLPFPSIVVASSNDEYVTLPKAREYADAWGSEFSALGEYGHINGASGLGDWADGYAMLGRLRSDPRSTTNSHER
jgi:uncharacterized protein